MKILLIDDVELILSTFGQLLSQLGHDVVTAADGLQAVEIFFEAPDTYHVIITDVKMPGLDGDVFAEMLAAEGFTTPIIFTTGHIGLPDVVGISHSGILFKPFRIGELLVLLDKIEKNGSPA